MWVDGRYGKEDAVKTGTEVCGMDVKSCMQVLQGGGACDEYLAGALATVKNCL